MAGEHPVEVALQPEQSTGVFKAAIDRSYVYIKFTATKGGTKLAVRLVAQSSDWSESDFSKSTGSIHLREALTIDHVKVRVVADFPVNSLTGNAHLVIVY